MEPYTQAVPCEGLILPRPAVIGGVGYQTFDLRARLEQESNLQCYVKAEVQRLRQIEQGGRVKLAKLMLRPLRSVT
eukprot:6822473-Karenia_brevis.AAC.1